MKLDSVVAQVARVRATSKKTEKVALLAELLEQARGEDAELVALFLTGSLRQGRIGLGWRGIENALESIQASSQRIGEPLTLAGLDRAFETVSGIAGAGSNERRQAVLQDVFARAAPDERRFLSELLLGEVRQGALEGLLLEAIASAARLPSERVREAAMFADGIGQVARAALEQGAAGLERFTMRLLRPVAPMLASPAADVHEALERLGEAAFEFKVDGARVQLHKAGNEVRVFTRQLQDVTDRVPELQELARGLPVGEVVLEGETIALRADGRPQPFQLTMRRFGRSRGIAEARSEMPLSSFFFDCLFLEGEGPLLGLPYRERLARLVRTVPPETLLPRIVTRDAGEAGAFLKRALDLGHEGLMAKSLEAPYHAGQRGFHWLKLKTAHTLDLAILAVEWGSGRRQGWLSNLHLGARDPETGGFVMLGKTFKGLTDAMLKWQTERLLALETRRHGHVVHVRPELVAEIAFSDVQESPRYPARLALRFARVKRYREDKRAAEADTIESVREIFERQRR
jgi:DNA ligase-1